MLFVARAGQGAEAMRSGDAIEQDGRMRASGSSREAPEA